MDVLLAYHRLRHPKLLGEALPTHILVGIEIVANESAYGTRIRSRSEWEEEKGEIESCRWQGTVSY